MDEQGEKQPAKPKRKKKMIPYKTWLDLHARLNVEISDFYTEKQGASMVTNSTSKPQETGKKQQSKHKRVKKTPAIWKNGNEFLTYGN